jgi:peptidoglycan L-alanyl-D-glutamate endopeptidase CwlK
VKVAERAIQITTIDFGIPSTGGLRTAEEQFELFKDRKSKADGVVKVSKHQLGRAIDFYAYVDGAASWDKNHLTLVAHSFMQAATELKIKIVWGGLWSNFIDLPHIQLGTDEEF